MTQGRQVRRPIPTHQQGSGLIKLVLGLSLGTLFLLGSMTLYQYQQLSSEDFLEHDWLQSRTTLTPSHMHFLKNTPLEETPLDLSHSLTAYRDIFPQKAELVRVSSNNIQHSDSFTLRYPVSWDKNLFNCSHRFSAEHTWAMSTYYINQDKQLVCVDLDPKTLAKSVPVILVNQVEAMHLRLGEDLNNDGQINRYLPPDQVLESQKFSDIKLSLLIKTTDQLQSGLNQKFYSLQDGEAGPFQDDFIRKVYTTDIKLYR